MKRWGVFLLGGGLGLVVGEGVGEAAALPGLVVAVLGLLLLIAGRRSGSRELVGDAMAARPWGPDDKPSFAHLGTRVEQILSLAEEQAGDHVVQAKAEADRILADARAEAGQILAEARVEAGQISAEVRVEAGQIPAETRTEAGRDMADDRGETGRVKPNEAPPA
jgi:vacuolar-type H+-ATPase subunit H